MSGEEKEKGDAILRFSEGDWMTISSRTPEGTPKRCPLCGAIVVVDSSRPVGDAIRLFDPSDPALLQLLADRLGLGPDAIQDGKLKFEGDSLDIVELVMALEESGEMDEFLGS